MNSKISRRDFLAGAAALAVTATLPWQAESQGKAATQSFEFIAANDLHFKDSKLCPPWFEKIFAAMIQSAPSAEFLIVSGDLTQDAKPYEFEGLKEMWHQLKIPVYVTPGNHDVSISGDMSMFEKYYPGSRNYVIKHKDWNIINLNSTESRAAENTNIPEDTFKWLDLNIKNLDPQTPTIISTHYPLGAGLVRRPLNSDRLLRRFSKFNLAAVFNGHWHGYTQTLYNNAYITTGRCCSRYRSNYDGSRLKGWFVCRAENGQVSRRFVAAPEELL